MLGGVFFDLDETLIDAHGCHREASRRAFAAFGMDWDEAIRGGGEARMLDRRGLIGRRHRGSLSRDIGVPDSALPARGAGRTGIYPRIAGGLSGAVRAAEQSLDRPRSPLLLEDAGEHGVVRTELAPDDQRGQRDRNATRRHNLTASLRTRSCPARSRVRRSARRSPPRRSRAREGSRSSARRARADSAARPWERPRARGGSPR